MVAHVSTPTTATVEPATQTASAYRALARTAATTARAARLAVVSAVAENMARARAVTCPGVSVRLTWIAAKTGASMAHVSLGALLGSLAEVIRIAKAVCVVGMGSAGAVAWVVASV